MFSCACLQGPLPYVIAGPGLKRYSIDHATLSEYSEFERKQERVSSEKARAEKDGLRSIMAPDKARPAAFLQQDLA